MNDRERGLVAWCRSSQIGEILISPPPAVSALEPARFTSSVLSPTRKRAGRAIVSISFHVIGVATAARGLARSQYVITAGGPRRRSDIWLTFRKRTRYNRSLGVVLYFARVS
jgi:hypothetical protein